MRRKKLLTLLIILTLAFIWGNSLLSKDASLRLSEIVRGWLNLLTAAGEEEVVTSFGIRKAAHVTEFAVLAVLLRLRLDRTGKRGFFTTWGCAAAAGGIDETIQIFSQRGSQFTDVCIDACGALLGLLLLRLFLRLRKGKKEKT